MRDVSRVTPCKGRDPSGSRPLEIRYLSLLGYTTYRIYSEIINENMRKISHGHFGEWIYYDSIAFSSVQSPSSGKEVEDEDENRIKRRMGTLAPAADIYSVDKLDETLNRDAADLYGADNHLVSGLPSSTFCISSKSTTIGRRQTLGQLVGRVLPPSEVFQLVYR